MQVTSLYKYKTTVRFSDTDKNGHVNNGKYFDYFEEARTTWAYEESDLMKWAEDNGVQFVIVEQSCKYIRPLLHPANIEVSHHIVKYGAASIEFEAYIKLCNSEELMATAKIKIACYNPRTNRPEKIPAHIKQTILKKND
ncbi:acyl-CoA thioesterase [Francisella adeliensis]|uniref:Thioesterase n=1 Tax=Francisella adeliensis TaxID=2007306 RepID=A0A2Z4Y079_9GAMM|nr:thioesterase family protein [Francisella adeliensis]AXA34035.1 thioesterase [Francisella adeliensis]MBK2085196.1 acyl-CoA thioesterase [Francisella adeliensis]MBK2096036.1 acyl-CoA thioesterase [Francisella adeliensis]QIW12273.1 acyl-CoA thioesterase [Francisella adeliensis]QIW14148.1 acyl-CoA thioesterase [Francisella adeliensis]